MTPAPTHPSQGSEPLVNTNICDERFAAAYLSISVETLRSWRQQNRGPRYRKLGRCVRYAIADLKAFIDAAPGGGGVAA